MNYRSSATQDEYLPIVPHCHRGWVRVWCVCVKFVHTADPVMLVIPTREYKLSSLFVLSLPQDPIP